MTNRESAASDEELTASGWVADDDGTFVTSMGRMYVRRVDGRVEVALQTDDRHKNLSGFVHGGVIMTLMDRAMGINCREATTGRSVTATITVNFLNAVRPGELIQTSCRLTRIGRTLIFADSHAHVGDRIIASASGTFHRMPATDAT